MSGICQRMILGFACLAILTSPVFTQDEIVFQSDFEKGTQSWEKRGALISTSKKQAASGKKSLRVSGRREVWQGAQINVSSMLRSGKLYKFSVSVKLDKKEAPDAIRMTMERGNNNFSGIAGANANSEGWTTLSGTFAPSGGDPYLLVFIEAGRSSTSYFLDDFKIEGAPLIPTQEGVLLKNDFEKFTAENWVVRGDNVQIFSSKPLRSSRGVRVAGRSEPWHGVALDISPMFFKGRTYKLSISVRLVKGEAPDSLKLIVQQTPAIGEKTYVNVAGPSKVTDAEWVTLSGDYLVTTYNNNLLICVEAEGAKTSFLIDNFELRRDN